MRLLTEDSNCVVNVLHTSLRGGRGSDSLGNFRKEKSTGGLHEVSWAEVLSCC